MIFTLGNLITLVIVLLVLALYWFFDRNNRSLEKVKKYAEKCKEDIASYAKEKSIAVENFGIDLDVERKAAYQLMKNIQKYTEEELTKKSEAISHIEQHINAFESSLDELNTMTLRVQENLNRIRDESAFVESTGKRVSEAKDKFEQYERALGIAEKNLAETQMRLEKKNEESLERAVMEASSYAKSMVSDFEATAQLIERRVEDHREALKKAENEREAVLAGDLELVKKTLKDALENAGKKADKIEDAALSKLREQAQERVLHIKTFFEEKIKSVQESLKHEQENITGKLKSINEYLNAETHDINARQKSLHQEWTKTAAEIEAVVFKQKADVAEMIEKQRADVEAMIEKQRADVEDRTLRQKDELLGAISARHGEISSALEKQSDTWKNLCIETDKSIAAAAESWKLLCRDSEQNIIAANEKRLEEYGKAQAEAVNRLSGIADDAARLENELQFMMQEAVTRVKKEFSQFEKEAASSMETAAGAFDLQAQGFRKELEEMDRQLNAIRQQAYDNVCEKLGVFENEFTQDLAKRAAENGRQIADWQARLQERFDDSEEKITTSLQAAEDRITAEQRKNINVLGDRLTGDLERLKTEVEAFEKGIREEIHNVEETRSAFTDQVRQNLSDIRVLAENEVRSQIGQYQVAMQETLRSKQRELEKTIEDLSLQTKSSLASLEMEAQSTRGLFDEWQSTYNARMRELDNSLEDLRRHSRETAIENDERVSQFRQNLDDIRREISLQKKIFDQTGELKQELERDMEEINGNLDRLDQRKNEIIQLENQLAHVKRIEDEVNRKMLSLLSEQHRLEVMEKNYERFDNTYQSVEAKLAQVTSSDDILLAMQVQIRKIEDALKETEDKYQRIERKNSVLEETNESIDRNFRSLQKTESAIKTAESAISALSDQYENIRVSIETLAAQNEKAVSAAEKISTLDDTLCEIEERIAKMNVAREWLARTERELNALDKDIREYHKLTKGLIDREGRKQQAQPPGGKGSPTPQDRDNVLRLREQGWTVEEIASTMNLARGEVELILEIGSRN